MPDKPDEAKLGTQLEIQLNPKPDMAYVQADLAHSAWVGSAISLTFYQVDYEGAGNSFEQMKAAGVQAAFVRVQAYPVSRVVMNENGFLRVLGEMINLAANMGLPIPSPTVGGGAASQGEKK